MENYVSLLKTQMSFNVAFVTVAIRNLFNFYGDVNRMNKVLNPEDLNYSVTYFVMFYLTKAKGEITST